MDKEGIERARQYVDGRIKQCGNVTTTEGQREGQASQNLNDLVILDALNEKREQLHEVATYLSEVALHDTPTHVTFYGIRRTSAFERFFKGAIGVHTNQPVARGWQMTRDEGGEGFYGEGYQTQRGFFPPTGTALLTNGNIGFFTEARRVILNREVDLAEQNIIEFSYNALSDRKVDDMVADRSRRFLGLSSDTEILLRHDTAIHSLNLIEGGLIRLAATIQ